MSATVLWRRLDLPGHDAARLDRVGEHWQLTGVAVFAHEGRPCRLGYTIRCDAEWRTERATIGGWIGGESVALDLARDHLQRWIVAGRIAPALSGCVDVDLGFSPSTNLLPIRRLGLAVGQTAPVRAAWVRFPERTVEVLEQEYRRTGPSTYHYASYHARSGGAFTRELTVNAAGFVVDYPGLWVAEAHGAPEDDDAGEG
jgi:hypothetical protein